MKVTPRLSLKKQLSRSASNDDHNLFHRPSVDLKHVY